MGRVKSMRGLDDDEQNDDVYEREGKRPRKREREREQNEAMPASTG